MIHCWPFGMLSKPRMVKKSAPGGLFEDILGVFAAHLVVIVAILLSRDFRDREHKDVQKEDGRKINRAKREERNGPSTSLVLLRTSTTLCLYKFSPSPSLCYRATLFSSLGNEQDARDDVWNSEKRSFEDIKFVRPDMPLVGVIGIPKRDFLDMK